jgi:hypothetical protein
VPAPHRLYLHPQRTLLFVVACVELSTFFVRISVSTDYSGLGFYSELRYLRPLGLYL